MRPVPLAWRNLTANKRPAGAFQRRDRVCGAADADAARLRAGLFRQLAARSSAGLDGDIFLQSAHKYQFATQDPFPAAALDTAKTGVRGGERAAALRRLVRCVLEESVRRQGVPGPRAWLSIPTSRSFRSPRLTPRRAAAEVGRHDPRRPPRPAFSRHGSAGPAIRNERRHGQDCRQLCPRSRLSERRDGDHERAHICRPVAAAPRGTRRESRLGVIKLARRSRPGRRCSTALEQALPRTNHGDDQARS